MPVLFRTSTRTKGLLWRSNAWVQDTREDFIMGLVVFLLVMELSRVVHPELFWMNAVLVVYTLWGYLSPVDFFWHPGTSFHRVITSSTVELSTGIYGQYAQIALTTIAAFLLLAAAARGFDAQGAICPGCATGPGGRFCPGSSRS